MGREPSYPELVAEAAMHLQAEQYAEAEPVLRKALVVGQQEWGTGSAQLLRAMRMLAISIDRRSEAGGGAEVIELRGQLVRICEKAYGVGSLEVAEELMNLAHVLFSQKKLAETAVQYLRASEIFEKHADEMSRDYARARLARAHFELGQNDDAIKYFTLSADGHDERKENPLRVIAHHGLGDALLVADQYDQARRHLEIALELSSKTPDSESSSLVSAIKASLAMTLH